VAGQSESSVQKGTGLGLSIAKKFTELLGGTRLRCGDTSYGGQAIGMESEIGKGSTFTVVLPSEYGE